MMILMFSYVLKTFDVFIGAIFELSLKSNLFKIIRD